MTFFPRAMYRMNLPYSQFLTKNNHNRAIVDANVSRWGGVQDNMNRTELANAIATVQADVDKLYALAGADVPDAAIQGLARQFSSMDDDQQAKFFVEVAKIMDNWPRGAGAIDQAFAIGRHLRTCTCSTDSARRLIETIYHGMVFE